MKITFHILTYRFIYLFDRCFMPNSRIFTYTTTASFMVGENWAAPRETLKTICRLETFPQTTRDEASMTFKSHWWETLASLRCHSPLFNWLSHRGPTKKHRHSSVYNDTNKIYKKKTFTIKYYYRFQPESCSFTESLTQTNREIHLRSQYIHQNCGLQKTVTKTFKEHQQLVCLSSLTIKVRNLCVFNFFIYVFDWCFMQTNRCINIPRIYKK